MNKIPSETNSPARDGVAVTVTECLQQGKIREAYKAASAAEPNSVADDWPPGPDELAENPELLEELRDCDPDYLDELLADNPELADDHDYVSEEEGV